MFRDGGDGQRGDITVRGKQNRERTMGTWEEEI